MSKLSTIADHDEWDMIQRGRSIVDKTPKGKSKEVSEKMRSWKRETENSPHNFSFAGTQM